MPDTRLELLQQITDWAKDPHSSQSVFWLTGFAGTGKSAIMRTMCERLDDENLLGASFFISRGDEKRRDPQNIVRTLIHDLAEMCPELRGPICDGLQENKFISDGSMDRQLQVLISETYARAGPALHHPVVLVLDGLDECEKDKDSGREGGELLPLLLRTIAACHPWLKLLIASRRERTIDKMFGSTHRPSLKLQDEEQSTRIDIERYLTDSLHAIAQAHSPDLPHDWPGENVVRELTGRSGNLFIYADTVVKLLKHSDIFPDEIFASILSQKPVQGIYSQLDAVYKHVLESAFSSNPLSEQRDALRSHLRNALGILLVLQAPVSVTELATFLELETRTMRLVLESISAVAVVPEDNVQRMTRLFHTSFTNFLESPLRCPDLLFKADVRGSHDTLTIVSYKLLAGEMRGPREYIDNFWRYHISWASLSAQQTAVETSRKALRSQPPGHDGRFDTLYCFAQALEKCYEHGGGHAYLEEAVHHRREMLKARSDDEDALGNLAYSLQYLFDQTGEAALLDEVIALNRKALELRPLGHPTRDTSLNNLANALLARFNQTGEAALLDEVIGLNREAVKLRPPGHPSRQYSLNNMALALTTQFHLTEKAVLLDEVIGLNREAVELCPPGHPSREYSLNNLAGALLTRFEHTAEAALLDEIVALSREAVGLHPPGHPTRDSSLNNLAHALLTRFRQTGEAALLDEVISLHREALELCPPGHPTRDISLSNLGSALCTRFNQTKEAALLDEVIALNREALELRPPGHPNRESALNDLAFALFSHYKHYTNVGSLAEAVILLQEALSICGVGHPDYAHSLGALADALVAQFEASNDEAFLTKSVDLYRQAVSHTGTEHPRHLLRLRRLSNVLRKLNAATGTADALEEAEQLEVELEGLEQQVRRIERIDTMLVLC
jgi:hypothetical protein